MQSLSKFMLEKVMGWKVVNRFPTELKKYIIIVAPHTSWVDFPVGVFVNYSEKLGANYIAKHTLFKLINKEYEAAKNKMPNRLNVNGFENRVWNVAFYMQMYHFIQYYQIIFTEVQKTATVFRKKREQTLSFA